MKRDATYEETLLRNEGVNLTGKYEYVKLDPTLLKSWYIVRDNVQKFVPHIKRLAEQTTEVGDFLEAQRALSEARISETELRRDLVKKALDNLPNAKVSSIAASSGL